MTAIEPGLVAATDRHVAETLDLLRSMAVSENLTGLPHHQAAVVLADMLKTNVDAATLANTLANLLLQDVRRDDLPPLDTQPDELADAEHVSPDLAGVEVRVIGPERACRRALARMSASGVPLVQFRGPRPADKQPGEVRFYAYTDPETQQRNRNRDRQAYRAARADRA